MCNLVFRFLGLVGQGGGWVGGRVVVVGGGEGRVGGVPGGSRIGG